MDSLFLQTAPLFCLLSAAAFLFSLWSYKRTVPQVQGRVRLVLVLLRAMTLSLTGFVLIRPVIEFSLNRESKPKAVLLVDDSRSMQLAENGRTRAERARKILKSAEVRAWLDSHDAALTRFSDGLRPVPESSPDSLTFQGSATDMASAFEALAATEEPYRPSEVILVSDGVNSLGRDPVRAAESLGIPIHTVCVGSARTQPDVQVTSLLAPRVVVAESDVTVEAFVRGEGFGAKPAVASLTLSGVRLAERKLVLPPDGLECSVRMNFRPMTPGTQTIRISIPRFSNEAATDNNAREQSIRVLRRKTGVLLLAAGPSPDFAFTKRILAADADVQLTTRTLKNANEFYEGPLPGASELHDIDVFILLNVPDRLFPEAAWRTVTTALLSDHKPCLWFAGASVDLQRLHVVESKFPAAAVLDSGERLVVPELSAEGGEHPVLRIFENPEENRKAWESLPPVYSAWARVAVGPGSAVLAEGTDERNAAGAGASSVPLIVCGRRGIEKSLAVFAEGVFRWDFVPGASGGDADLLKKFLGNSLRWLAAEESGKPVRFVNRDLTAQAGGEISFAVQATDEIARPLAGADVSVSFIEPRNEPHVPLDESIEGLYRGVFRPSEPGAHRAVVEARIDGRVAGRDTVSFRVTPYAAELLDTRANPDLMRSLSAATGGTVIPPDSLALLSRLAKVPVETVKIHKRIELFGLPWLLIPAGIFLVLEWILRKRAGMA
jgi:hypothetical protein